VIEMRFAPDDRFRAALVLGAGLAALLVALALWPSRHRRRRGCGTTAAGEAVLSAEADSKQWTKLLTTTWLAVLTVAVFLIAGPVALAVPALVGLERLAPGRAFLPWVCAGSASLAGLAVALKTGYLAGPWLGNGSYTAQALGALALATLAASLVPSARRPQET
jgi:arabinofuranan 3-O-arabinosyltransferase